MPAFSTALIWTKASLPPVSGTMKPKPRVASKKFTLPMGMDLVLSGRTGREWHVPWGLEGRNGREKQAPAGSEPPAGATPSEAGGDERQARPHRGGAAGDDAVAIEIGEAEMGVARGNAGGG